MTVAVVDLVESVALWAESWASVVLDSVDSTVTGLDLTAATVAGSARRPAVHPVSDKSADSVDALERSRRLK